MGYCSANWKKSMKANFPQKKKRMIQRKQTVNQGQIQRMKKRKITTLQRGQTRVHSLVQLKNPTIHLIPTKIQNPKNPKNLYTDSGAARLKLPILTRPKKDWKPFSPPLPKGSSLDSVTRGSTAWLACPKPTNLPMDKNMGKLSLVKIWSSLRLICLNLCLTVEPQQQSECYATSYLAYHSFTS